jgi:hypothetical protein
MEPGALSGSRAAHHDLCFGCGLANVFGLAMEATRGDDGRVTGRFFVKQDHQGADGAAHPGVLAAALVEALSLAAGAVPPRLEIDLLGAAPVGTMVDVEASAAAGLAGAVARGEGGVVARATGRGA